MAKYLERNIPGKYSKEIFQGLFLRGGPHYLCGKREESAIASHGHGQGGTREVIHAQSVYVDW